MRIAVVGAGVAGTATAYLLQSTHQVTLFERAPHAGGHATSMTIAAAGATVHVDLGFRYFFKGNYPYFLALLRILGVRPRWMPGSFTLVDAAGRAMVLPPRRLRHVAGLLRAPRRLRWLLYLLRLRRAAGEVVRAADWSLTLAAWLATLGYPAAFGPELLYPFVAANWGVPLAEAPQLPAYDICKVMLHPIRDMGFYVFAEGSGAYMRLLEQALADTRREFGVGVARLTRDGDGYRVTDDRGREHAFDAVVLACESFTAAALLAEVSDAGAARDVLAGFRHFDVDIVVHGDASRMPPRRDEWSTNNHFHRPDGAWMTDWPGSLQSAPVFRTWLAKGQPEPRDIHARRTYRHLLVTRDHGTLQRRLAALQGRGGLWFAGMYTTDVDNHESALVSAVTLARALAPDSPALRRLEDEARS